MGWLSVYGFISCASLFGFGYMVSGFLVEECYAEGVGTRRERGVSFSVFFFYILVLFYFEISIKKKKKKKKVVVV